jgi:hypothetical protein
MCELGGPCGGHTCRYLLLFGITHQIGWHLKFHHYQSAQTADNALVVLDEYHHPPESTSSHGYGSPFV